MASILNHGNYEVYFDAGSQTNSFRLDVSTLNGSDVLEGTTQFFDVTAYVTAVAISRGREKYRTPIGAGRCTILIDDTNGDFSVVNSNSPYWDTTNNRLGFQPTRRVKVYRNGEQLFNGQIVTYDQQLTLDNESTITVGCSDDLRQFNGMLIEAFNPTPQSSGDRLNYVLDRPDVNLFLGVNERIIDQGVAILGNQLFEGNESLGNYFERIQLAEQGRIFITRDGRFCGQQRIGRAKAACHVATLSDRQDGGILFNTFKVVYE